MKLKALADLSVPLIDREVRAGDVIDVPDDPGVVWDPALFEPVKDTSSKPSKKEG